MRIEKWPNYIMEVGGKNCKWKYKILILILIIFYIDDITTDNANCLNFILLNMILGIFNIQTRMKAEV